MVKYEKKGVCVWVIFKKKRILLTQASRFLESDWYNILCMYNNELIKTLTGVEEVLLFL